MPGPPLASILQLSLLIGHLAIRFKCNFLHAMNKLRIKGGWNIVKGRIKQHLARLTDNDLRYAEGQEDELVGRIQKRLNETRREVERLLRECGKEN
jgi:uncharacterized protein YjbJ (UPF0337 family)